MGWSVVTSLAKQPKRFEMWLKKFFSDSKNTTECFHIRSKLYSSRRGSMSVTEYYDTLMELWQQINSFYDQNWYCKEMYIFIFYMYIWDMTQ